MKKFLTFVLTMLILLMQNAPCYAMSALYYLHNANKNDVQNIVQGVLTDKNYSVKKTSPIVAYSTKDNRNFAVIVLQKSGQNLFYYFESNDSTKSKLNNKILKEFSNNKIFYEQSENQAHLDSFSKISVNALTNIQNNYTFEEERPIFESDAKPAEEKKRDDTTLSGYVAKVPKGTKFNVFLQNSLNTAVVQKGDVVTALFTNDWFYNNVSVIPQGSFMKGHVVDCHPALHASRNGMVKFKFTELYTPNGEIMNISTQPISFNVTDDGRVKRFIGSAAANAALGALVGLAFGLLGGDASSALKGAAIGAGIGAGTSVITSTAAKGVDAEIPALTELEIELDKPLSFIVNR